MFTYWLDGVSVKKLYWAIIQVFKPLEILVHFSRENINEQCSDIYFCFYKLSKPSSSPPPESFFLPKIRETFLTSEQWIWWFSLLIEFFFPLVSTSIKKTFPFLDYSSKQHVPGLFCESQTKINRRFSFENLLKKSIPSFSSKFNAFHLKFTEFVRVVISII